MTGVDKISLAEMVEVNPSVNLAGVTPDTPVSFIPMSDVSETGRWTGRQERRISEVRTGYTPFAEGDLVFAKITPCMENGKGAHLIGLKNGIGFGSTEFHVLRSNKQDSARFIYHWLQSETTRVRALAFMGGSAGQQRVQAEFFSHFKIPVLSLHDQQTAAAFLDAVDDVIDNTERVISKLKQIRTGLLYGLLTRGIDENGQLRDPVAHPEQFKDSRLGLIPKQWEVRGLRACYSIPSQNGLYKKPRYYGSGSPMIHMPQMFRGLFASVIDTAKVEVGLQELQKYRLQEGDLLFARRSLNLEGAGLCCLVPQIEEPTTFESSIIRVRVNTEEILPRFAAEFLRSEVGYRLRRKFIRQVAVSGVSSEDVGQFLLPLPDPTEQRGILRRLEAHDITIDWYKGEVNKMRWLKSGLMSDLLTGRVRVPESVQMEGS